MAALAPLTRESWRELAPDVAALGVVLVNVCFVGTRDAWTLVDAGLPHTANYLQEAAEERFGVRPLPADGSVPTMPGWQAIHTPATLQAMSFSSARPIGF